MGGGREKEERDDRRDDATEEGVSDRVGACWSKVVGVKLEGARWSKVVGVKLEMRGLDGVTSSREESDARWAWVW